MAEADAERWDERYRSALPGQQLSPPGVVAVHLADLPRGAKVLDAACGMGDAGLWLAERGAESTFADVSAVALDLVDERAKAYDLTVETNRTDLELDTPTGPWDAIVCVHYLDRAMLGRLAQQLDSNGRLVVAIATVTNLERHDRPSARFLLDRGELAQLVPGTSVLHFDEAWRANGVHEAWGVFRRADTD